MLKKHPNYKHFLLSASLLITSLPVFGQSQDPAQIRRDINRLESQMGQKRQQSDTISDEVTRMEKKLGEIAKQEHDTEKKIDATVAKLREANERKQGLESILQEQRLALAQQLQAMYTAGEQSHLRLLLRQDNPADISRSLRYFEYLNKHRTQKIKETNATLDELRAVTQTIEQDRLKLSGLEETLAAQKNSIQTTLNSRAAVLKQVNADLRSQQRRLERLYRDEAKVQAVIEAIANRPEPTPAPPPARQAAEPAATPTRPTAPTQELSTANASNRAFSTLKGRLPSPVNGKVLHRYGEARNEKQRWQGLVIAAPGGEKVRAVARGRVAFAGWMDAYGYLIIIEHDRDYVSLYGYNRALYKQEGQTVNAGEVIAAVGNSSGRNENALYFEIRHRSKQQNPAQWLR